MESNIFIKDIYDFGLIAGCITIIWMLSSTFFRLKHQKQNNYVSCLSWMGLIIASLSNVVFTYGIFFMPITLYAWEKCKSLETKFDPPVL